MNVAAEEPLVFECRGTPLVGILHRPAAVRGAIGVLVVVGGPQYRGGSHRQFTLMARALAAEGYPVLRFDMRGMGDCPGEIAQFEHVAQDIAAGMEEFLRRVPTLKGLVLWGLCDGASAILMHACSDARVRGLVLVNPWVHSEAREAAAYVRHYYGRRLLQRGFWTKLLSFRVEIRKSLREWLRQRVTARDRNTATPYVEQMLAGLKSFRGRVLILLSEHDLVARQFDEICRQQVEWGRTVRRPGVTVRPLAGADHTFSDRAKLDEASQSCARWLAEGGWAA
ncbi:MAG: hydrolase 1, exosortase A system-associated [Gammaproteobacteria bacterium]